MATSLRRRRSTERTHAAAALTTAPAELDRRVRMLTASVVVVVAVGVALRFLTSSHLWLDEAVTVLAAHPDRFAEAIHTPVAGAAVRHPGPLTLVAIRIMRQIFGAGSRRSTGEHGHTLFPGPHPAARNPAQRRQGLPQG